MLRNVYYPILQEVLNMNNEILSKEEILNLYENNKQNLCRVLKTKYITTYNFIDINFTYVKPNNIHNNSGKNKFSEKIYQYVYNIKGICKQCNINPTTFRSFSEGYFDFCSYQCQHLNIASKYGVTNLFQSEKIKQKIKETSLKKYGTESPMQSEFIINKGKISKLERYGDKNYVNIEKFKKTCMERYGVSNPNKLNSVKLKVKNSHIKKYGGMGMGSKITMDKIKSTNFKKYGTEIPMHNNNLFEKNKIAGFKLKEYIFPSGRKEKIQGYENFALNFLLKTCSEDDIITNRKLIPKFSYDFEGKIRKYYPDIFVKSKNLVIETKSSWTSTLHPIIDELKKQSVLDAGFNFKKFIFNNKGELINE